MYVFSQSIIFIVGHLYIHVRRPYITITLHVIKIHTSFASKPFMSFYPEIAIGQQPVFGGQWLSNIFREKLYGTQAWPV